MIYGFGPHRLDTDRLELWCSADAVAVEPQVFRLLQHLIENRGRVVSKISLCLNNHAAADSYVGPTQQQMPQQPARHDLGARPIETPP